MPGIGRWSEATGSMRPRARRRQAGGMITFRNVCKQRGRVRVLDDISFEAHQGRVTGFVGRNGAGKSSSLRILLGLDSPSSGSALFDGSPYRELARPLTKVGACLGGAGAHPARRAIDHLRWLAASNGIPSARVATVLDQVELTHAARQRVGTFSLGMAQRLGLAAALLGEPSALVLDEPINGLDPDGVRWLRRLVRSHADEGGTVLMSSHVIAELAEVADDIVVIDRGRIRAQGTRDELVAGHESLEHAFFALTPGGAA